MFTAAMYGTAQAAREAEVVWLRERLAECFNLGGADADGNATEWRALHAVRSVRQLRADYDSACDEAERLRERVAELEQEWMKHPQTVEAKAQWDAVALALWADKDCPDSVLAAAHRLRAENEATREDAERYRALRSVLRESMTEAQYDACIDAARAARGEG